MNVNADLENGEKFRIFVLEKRETHPLRFLFFMVLTINDLRVRKCTPGRYGMYM